MSGVPYTFGTATTSIPLSNLDSNFVTPVTIGNASVALGNTISAIGNLTLNNVTINSGTSNIASSGNITIGNTTITLGNTVTTLGNVTLTNVNIVSGTVPVPTSIANGTSNVSISSSGGNINVVTGGTIATFPQSTGTVMVSGNMPAFSAYQSSTQSINSGTITNTIFNIKTFDTAICFNNTNGTVTLNGISTPAYAFAPNVAGYYQINTTVSNQYSFVGYTNINIYKNGSAYVNGLFATAISSAVSYGSACCSTVIYFNGTSDYIQIYSQGNANMTLAGCSFSGSLIRAA